MGAGSLTYSVRHRTVLRYSATVTLSSNEVRMRPLARGRQRSHSFVLDSVPPSAPRSRIDYFGNIVHRVDLAVPHDQLTLTTESMVEVDPVGELRPRHWDAERLQRTPVLEFALPSPRVALLPEVEALRREWVGDDAGIDAMLECGARIRREFRYVTGATTVDSGLDELLSGGAGVCQDFSHLFLAMLRGAGWPARYVSGYLGPAGEERETRGASHAWVEICGADGRWLGFDPTHGEPVGQHHIRLALGRDYGDVPPHRGLFYADAVGAPPEVMVHVSLISPQLALVVRTSSAVWQQQQQQQAGRASG